MNTPMTSHHTDRKQAAALLSITAGALRPLRIPRIEPGVHPVLVGNRDYLRALRAAEMAAWEAGQPMALATSFSEVVARAEVECDEVDSR